MRQNSDGTGAVAAGDPVGWWLDKSATGATVTGSGAARPTLSATGFNGKQALVFNGVSPSVTNLSRANYTATNNLSGMTRIAVCAHTTNTLGMLSRVTPAGSDSFMQMNGSARLYVANPGGFLNITLSTNNSIVPSGLYGEVFSNSAISFFSSGSGLVGTPNGTIPATTDGGTPTLHIGSNVGANFPWNGPIAEYIIFNRALTRAELASVEAYLAQRWGISGVHAPATASSDPVGYWQDKSGNGRHLTQPLSVARPSLLPTGISSKPALNFDGTDDNIWRQPGLTSDDLSILIVHQTNTLSGGITYEFTHSGDITNSQATNTLGFGNVAGLQVSLGGLPTYMCDVVRSFTQIDLQGRSGSAGDISANVPVIGTHCVSYSETASAIRKQAWASGKGMLNSGRFNCGGWSAITLGARRNNQNAGGLNIPTVFLNGRIAEVIAYSRYISDAERRKLELYLARKYSVTLTGAPIVSNPDAQDWIDRVYAAGGSVSVSQAAAVNDFANAIDNAGIRDKFYRLNLGAGGTSGTAAGLNSSLVPLYLGPTSRGVRFGGTTDTNVGPFTSADYSTTGGLLAGFNSGKYLDTGLASNAMPQSVYQAMHLSAWHGNIAYSGADPCLIGAYNGSADRNDIHICLRTVPASDDARLGQTQAVFSATQFTGARTPASYIVSRTSPTSLRLYRNGAFEAENTISVTSPGSALPLFIHRRNNSGTPNGEQTGMSIWAYSIGAGMTAQQVTDYYNAMTAFNTAMGRI